MELAIYALCAYLLGSIPFGLLVVRFWNHVNLRDYGSGNIGATNAMRVMMELSNSPGSKNMARLLGIGVFLLDFLKGFVPAFMVPHVLSLDYLSVELLQNPVNTSVLMGVAAFLGHMFPIYIGFKGGKGVATACGFITGTNPALGGIAFGSWMVCLLITRYVSVSSMVAAAILGGLSVYWHSADKLACGLLVVISVLVILKHKSNIQRLKEGTEPKVFSGKKKEEQQVGD